MDLEKVAPKITIALDVGTSAWYLVRGYFLPTKNGPPVQDTCTSLSCFCSVNEMYVRTYAMFQKKQLLRSAPNLATSN
jgi:hypothetical protein